MKKPAVIKKPAVPRILPREPLTKKARAAIEKYVIVKGEKGYLCTSTGVTWTLEAERMRRSDLYAWLENKGCQWRNGWWFTSTPPEKETLPNG